MSKEKEILDILSLYESILKTKSINEVSNASSELFGGSNVSIPSDGAHGGQSGWQSNNAWDIKATIGTPVYAVIGGTLKTYNDYGPTPIKKDGKTLFGAGFTVDSDDGLPDVYYTHLKDVTVKQGDKVTCGQLLGYVMDFPGSDYDHLHIGVESGNVRQFLNDNGTLKCANGQSISGTTVTGNSSETAYNAATSTSGAVTSKSDSVFDAPNVAKDDYLVQMGKSIASKFLKTENTQLGEQKSFGRDVSNRYGRIIIPKDTNPKIKSPISGVVFNKRYSSSCTNQITIKNEDNKKFYLQFCGISSPMVRDGQSISVGDVIGKTDSDVEVTMLDGSWNTVPIGSGGIKTDSPKKDSLSGKNNKKNQSGRSSVFDSDRTPIDNITSMVSSLPAKAIDKVFGNKYDEKTGEMTQKRWGGVADEREVDPWILNFIKDPLGRKKVTENVEKIKRLLK